jgi:hypothetical protein
VRRFIDLTLKTACVGEQYTLWKTVKATKNIQNGKLPYLFKTQLECLIEYLQTGQRSKTPKLQLTSVIS